MRTRFLLSLVAGLMLLPLSGCCFSKCNVCLIDDTATTTADQPVVIDVLANDVIGSKVTINAITTLAVSQGSAVVNTDNTITYTPEASATGEATFEYQVCYTCTGGNSHDSSSEETCKTALVTVTIEDATDALASLAAAADTQPQQPASVMLVNSSNFEITVRVGGQEVDVVQPLGSTVVPAEIASGDSQTVEVEALLPSPDPARVTSTSFSFAPTGRYTITYTDDNVSAAAINVTETP